MPVLAASLSRIVLAGAVLAVAACAREDEAMMRARLERWFLVGETLYFAARMGCATGVFRLTDDSIGAAMPVAGSVPGMLHVLRRQGRAALDDPDQAPDAALVALANADRATGYRMRRAGLEARACMDGAAEGAFRAGLVSKAAVLAYDDENGMLVLLDRENRRIFAAMGEA